MPPRFARGIASPLKLRCSGGGLRFACRELGICLQRVCLARTPQAPRQASQETSAHRPPAATFAFRRAGSFATSRGMPSFPCLSRFAEGVFYRWKIRKGRAKLHIPARATASRFFVASVEYARGMLHKVGFVFICGYAVPPAGAARVHCGRLTVRPFKAIRMRGGEERCI